ncbi:MAG TPA: M90 family metallopeptidase [Burkholderiaceae bacterium]|nr:M90 family metallopeptidase [Burkholderiaceae bacterium]
MFGWLRKRRAPRLIPEDLWQSLLARYSFLAERPAAEVARLHILASEFLVSKEFHGAHGFAITDEVAAAIAAQAVLPVLHLGRAGDPASALRWYDDFVGIVVHPGEAVAKREMVDDSGVVHAYDEVLAGEAMEGGPVMLSWPDVADAGASAEQGYNVVIHEFAHKIDMRDGAPDGCPPLPPGFLGAPTARAARAAWLAVLQPAYDAFREKVIIAERFGGAPTWLDPYGAEALDEFFAVACEAYFVNPARFSQEFSALAELFDAFFRPAAQL